MVWDPYALTDEEVVCQLDGCTGVTFGLYLSMSADRNVWREGLARGLRLVEPLPNGEPDIDWAACERGERPHPDFDCSGYEDWKRGQEAQQEFVP